MRNAVWQPEWTATRLSRLKSTSSSRRWRGSPEESSLVLPLSSKVYCRTNLGEPRGHHQRRSEPRPAGDERLVVVQDRARVEHVVDIETDVGAGPAEAQDLGDSQVDFVDAIAPDLTRRQQVHRHVGHVA